MGRGRIPRLLKRRRDISTVTIIPNPYDVRYFNSKMHKRFRVYIIYITIILYSIKVLIQHADGIVTHTHKNQNIEHVIIIIYNNS